MANLKYRIRSDAPIPGSTQVLTQGLTSEEIDGNFRSLDVAKVERVGEETITGSLTVDNIKTDLNTISSVDTNGNINLEPNGTGNLVVYTDTIELGGSSGAPTTAENVLVTTRNASDLTLNTNNGASSGYITIFDAADSDITIEPNGTGNVNLVTDTVRLGSLNENSLVTTQGTGDLTLNTNGGTDSGNIKIFDGANNNIELQVNGTGVVVVNELGNAADLRVEGDTDVNLLFVDGSADRVAVGTNAPTNKFHVQQTTATTNAVTDVFRIDSQSSGTPAVGIGVGMEFAVETAAGNTEVGASIEAVTTDVTAASEDFDLVFRTMIAGAAAAQVGKLNNNTLQIGATGVNTTLTTLGTADLTINTNAGTNSGSIVIPDGANQSISIEPNGTGNLIAYTDRIEVGGSSGSPSTAENVTITTRNASDLTLTTNNDTNSGNIKIFDGANGNIELQVNGTGTVVVNEAAAAADFRVEGNADQNLLFVDGSANNVGVGTDAPGSKLAVAGLITELYNSTYWNVVTQVDIGTDPNQVPLNQYLGQLAFADEYSPSGLRRTGAGSNDVDVDSNGRVGIGISSPETLLHVYGTTDPTIKIQSDGTDEISGRLSLRQSNDTGADILYDGTNSVDALVVKTYNAGTYQADGMRISLAGNVTLPQNLSVLGSVVINEDSADVDVRIEGDADANLFFTDGGNDRVAVGTNAPATKLHIQQTSATTNAVTDVLRLDSQSTGTPANGIGVGMEFAVETAEGNTEVGAAIEAVATDVTATSEDFDLVFRTMIAGAAAAQVGKLNNSSLQIGANATATTLTTQGNSNLTIRTGSTNSGSILINQGDNANIVVEPHGTGDVYLNADTVRVGDSGVAATVTTNGTGNLTIRTGSTNSGSILINQGDNANIEIEPHGTGDVHLNADTVRVGDSNAAATVTTNGTGNLTIRTGSTNSGSILINQGDNANIVVEPHGTGDVYLNADTVRVGDANAEATIVTNGTGNLVVKTGSANTGSITLNQGDNGVISVQTHGTGEVVINDAGNASIFRVESDGDANLLFTDGTNNRVGIGLAAPQIKLHIQQTTAATNTVTDVLRLDSQSSNTPASGIGVGLEFAVETAEGNTEVGATIEAVTTDVTATSEDFDLVFRTMIAGAAAAQVGKFNHNTLQIGANSTATTLTTQGNANLTIKTGSTNSGTILINQGDDGNIDIEPHNTGDVNLITDTVRIGSNNENVKITTQGTGDITIDTNAGTDSGFIKIFDGANQGIEIQSNGTGEVVINNAGNASNFRVESDGDENVLFADGTNNRIGIGLNVPTRKLHVQQSSSATNAVTQVLRIDSQSTGTPAIGIGAGLEFATETAAGNTEVGATIEALTTNVGAGTEDFDLLFKTMGGGAAATEKVRIKSDGRVGVQSVGSSVKFNVFQSSLANSGLSHGIYSNFDVALDGTDLTAGRSYYGISSAISNLHRSSASFDLNVHGAYNLVDLSAASGYSLPAYGNSYGTWGRVNVNMNDATFKYFDTIMGVNANAVVYSTANATLNNVYGLQGSVNVVNTSSATITNLVAVNADLRPSSSTSAVTNAYMFRGVLGASLGSTNLYGLHIGGSINNYIAGGLNVGGTAPTGTSGQGLTVDRNAVFNESGGDFDVRIEGDNDNNLFFTDASVDRIGIGLNAPSNKLHVQQSSATTNAVTQVLRLDSQSTGTPANGIGVGMEFAVETAAGNTEVGAAIEAVVTDITDTNEDFDLLFRTMIAGAAVAQVGKLNNSTLQVGANATATTILTQGNSNLTLKTGSTNSGTILINQGDNANIEVTPHGTGDVYLTADTVRVGDANASATVVTNGTGNLVLKTGSTNTGDFTITQGDNGNITLNPHGTGLVSVTKNLDVDLDVNIDGGDLTTNQTSFNIIDTNATTVNAFGAATTLTVGHDGASASTTNIAIGATADTLTKTINIGTAGAAGSTTNVNIGSGNTKTVGVLAIQTKDVQFNGSGNIIFADSGTTKRGVIGTSGGSDQWFVGGGATASDSGFLEIATGDNGNAAAAAEPIHVRQYQGGSPLTGTITRTATLLDNNGNTTFPGIVTASSFAVPGLANGSISLTTTSTTQTAIHSVAFADYDGGKYVIQAKRGTDRQITEVLVTHNGSTAIATEYAVLMTGPRLFTVDVDINSTNMRVLITATAATSTTYRGSFSLLTA